MSKNNQPHLPPPPGDEERRAEARAARHAAMTRQQEEARRQERKRKLLLQAGLPVLVVVVVVAVTVLVLAVRGSGEDPIAIKDRPELVDENGALSFGAKDPKVVIQVVEDFQCPICQQFEATAGDLLAQYRADPRIQVQYRPIAFLDRVSTTRYSSRASNAAACVAAEGPETWLAFHKELFDHQPAEGGAGLTDSELLDLAEKAGADTDRISDCVEDESYADWVKATTTKTLQGEVTGTPTIFVDGTKVDGFDAASIQAAVEKALS
ncbi:DsbA family protein [Nocardioides sp. LML1-1-1.1]|uniref:DsbA family protein n=1 Tax=Nocardioides sp. LML1-1-1.1 TaxID=3135248 RepID=UPI003433D1C9